MIPEPIPVTPPSPGTDVYYELTVALRLYTYIDNDDSGFTSNYELDGPFKLGSANPAPLVMEGSVSETVPTPLPGSLVLLLSGLGGFVTVRRRFLQAN